MLARLLATSLRPARAALPMAPRVSVILKTVCVCMYAFAWISLLLYSLYRAVRADPGFVPRPPGNNQGEPGQAGYCDKCAHRRPDRAHHCKVCQRCVKKMDHVSSSQFYFEIDFSTTGWTISDTLACMRFAIHSTVSLSTTASARTTTNSSSFSFSTQYWAAHTTARFHMYGSSSSSDVAIMCSTLAEAWLWPTDARLQSFLLSSCPLSRCTSI